MKLKKLLHDIPIQIFKGSKEVEVTGLCAHSRRVAPGSLFIAKRGYSDDGSKYIEEAIAHGAVAVLCDMANPFLKGVVQIIHPDPASIEGELAARYYGHPSEALFTVGITGTNGKTTISYLIKHLLDHLDRPSGLIGTVEYLIGKNSYVAELTTPDVITNHKMLREMCQAGDKAAVMEVTSHALAQNRVDLIGFDVALFTNLTQEQRDYHETMESYAEMKSRLFSSLAADKMAVINRDSPWAERMVKQCGAKVLTYGFTAEADIWVDNLQFSDRETTFSVTFQGETIPFCWKHVGRFNVENCLGALGVCLSQGIALSSLAPLVSSFLPIAGRLERVSSYPIFVDFAHTPDALKNVLRTLRECNKGRLIALFGCGGDRDREKRKEMGAIAEKEADFSIITSDNPRSEDPMQICQEIVAGFRLKNYLVEPDRRAAIKKAIEMRKPEDLILIAGKGHEAYQIFSHQRIPFDDKQVVLETIQSL